MNATKNGIDNCPNCKAVDEVIIENAFLEAFRLLADSFDDVLQSVLNTIEDILKDDTELKRVKQLEKDISTIESKKSRLKGLSGRKYRTAEEYKQAYVTASTDTGK